MAPLLNPEQKQTAIWLAVGVAILIILRLLGPILMPFVTAAILAYILNPGVDRLCRVKLGKRHISRPLSTAIVMLSLIAGVLALILIVVPVLQKEMSQLQTQIPDILDKLNENLAPVLRDLDININLDIASLKTMLSQQLSTSGEAIGKALLSSVRVGGTAVIGMLANLLLIPIVLFYLLLDWHPFLARIEHLIPRRWLPRTHNLTHEVNDLLAQYLRGQLMVMLALAVYYSSALAIARFDVALPVGIITGLLVFIPYVGFSIGLLLALISAVLQFQGLHGLLAVAIIYGFGQFLEGFVLTPRLVGERIGLHPLTVIFALLAFGQLFGFVGILLALPISAITSVAVKHLSAYYFSSPFYHRS
jgi:predicted PurR-regulated permease PerM